MHFPHLQQGLNHFKYIGCTKLVEQLLAGIVFAQMLAKSGLKKHGVLAKQALLKEFAQLNDMNIMEPLDLGGLSVKQKRLPLGLVNLIKQKRDHTKEHSHLKKRSYVNGKPQHPSYAKEEKASPVVSLDAFMLILIIDAKDKCDMACTDIVGAYLHA